MKLKQSLFIAGLAAVIGMAASTAMAQDDGAGAGNGAARRRNGGGGGPGGGNFDPAQFQQQRMDRIHEQMGVTDETEWKTIQDRAQKVFDAQLATFAFRARGGFGRGGGGGGGGAGRGGFGGPPSPEVESLQSAIENNAPTDQIKAALEKYRAARKAKEDALAKAQADLQKVLTIKQEAVAVSNGLLN